MFTAVVGGGGLRQRLGRGEGHMRANIHRQMSHPIADRDSLRKIGKILPRYGILSNHRVPGKVCPVQRRKRFLVA